MALFLMECRKLLKSVIYYIFIFMVIITFLTQFRHDLYLHGAEYRPAESGSEEYMCVGDDPDKIMSDATKSLLMNYMNNQYTTYPWGYGKRVHTNDGDSRKIALILERITGISADEIESKRKENSDGAYGEYMYTDFSGLFEYEINPELSFDDFCILMYEVDDILGGGSSYSEENLCYDFGLEPMDYDDIMKEFDDFEYKDRITNGYARLHCDYYSIFLILFVAFVAAIFMTADRRSHMEQLIDSRRISSLKLVMTRFAAQSFMLFWPLLFMALWAHLLIIKFYSGYELDHLAMYKYTFVWLLPSVLSGTGIAMLLTELFSGIAAVLIQSTVWYIMNMKCCLAGSIGRFDLIIRHNTNMERQYFMDQLDVFIFNRCFYTVFSIVCVIITAFVYNLKREGRFNGFRVLDKLFKHESEA